MPNIPTIKPVTNDTEHDVVLAVLQKFVDQHYDCTEGSPEAAYISTQGLILSDYEKHRWPIPKEWGEEWDPVDYIKAIVAERQIPQRELASCFGSQPNCSAVLNRRRGLTLPMIRKLHGKLGIPADILIREPKGAQHPPAMPVIYPIESAPPLTVNDSVNAGKIQKKRK